MRTNIPALVLVSALVLAGAGVGGVFAATTPLHAQQSANGTETTTAGGASSGSGSGSGGAPSITFNDQNSSGESIVVQSATLPEKGFVVINGTSGGTDHVIGSSYPLSAGTSDNIRIQLDRPLDGSQSLTAVLYADSNGNGQFDPGSAGGKGDQPVYLGNSDRRIVSTADVSAPSNNAGSETQTTSGGTATTASPATGTNATAQTNATQTTSGGNAATTGTANTGGESNQSNQSNQSASGGGNGSGGGGGSGAFGPGFGPVVAVVALLAVALLVRRR